MYRIIHNLVEIRAEHLLIPSDSRTRRIAAFGTIYTRADVYRFSFFPRTIITWNSIPPKYVRPVPSASSRQGQGPLPFPYSPRCKQCSTLFLTVNTILILMVQYGHAELTLLHCSFEYTLYGKKKKRITGKSNNQTLPVQFDKSFLYLPWKYYRYISRDRFILDTSFYIRQIFLIETDLFILDKSF